MVLFGGANPKNTLVSKGGCASHSTGGWIAELARAGVEVVNISPIREDGPEAVRPEWIPIRPNTDTAMLLALTHTLVSEGLHDREFLAKFCVGFERVLPYLMGETDGQPKDADWAAAITGVPADTIRALARRMAATRTMVTASWSLQRAHHGEQPYWAVVLLGVGARPDRAAGRRLRFRLWLRRRHRAIRRCVRGAGDGRHQESDQRHDPGGAHLRLPAQSRRAVTTSTASAATIPTSGWSIGPAAIRSIITRTPTSCAAPGRSPRPSWCTSRGGPRPRATPTSCCRRPRRWSATTSAARARDKFIIAMQQAVEPVGEARNDFDIFSASGAAARLSPRPTRKGRDEKAWLRHLYEQMPPQRRRQRRGDAGLRHVLGDGLSGNSGGRPRNT